MTTGYEESTRNAAPALGKVRGDEATGLLLTGWKGYPPRLRAHVLDVMLSRPLSVDVKKTRGEPVTQIRFHADEPEALAAAAQAQLDSRRAAPEPRGGGTSPA